MSDSDSDSSTSSSSSSSASSSSSYSASSTSSHVPENVQAVAIASITTPISPAPAAVTTHKHETKESGSKDSDSNDKGACTSFLFVFALVGSATQLDITFRGFDFLSGGARACHVLSNWSHDCLRPNAFWSALVPHILPLTLSFPFLIEPLDNKSDSKDGGKDVKVDMPKNDDNNNSDKQPPHGKNANVPMYDETPPLTKKELVSDYFFFANKLFVSVSFCYFIDNFYITINRQWSSWVSCWECFFQHLTPLLW